jgi:hypothetical protein
MNMSRLRHISIYAITTLTVLVALCNFSNPLQAQKDGPSEAQIRKQMESNLKFTPYSRTAPVKPNVFGNYPKLNNVPAWDGREAGVYSVRFKFRTITPAKATPKITNIYPSN